MIIPLKIIDCKYWSPCGKETAGNCSNPDANKLYESQPGFGACDNCKYKEKLTEQKAQVEKSIILRIAIKYKKEGEKGIGDTLLANLDKFQIGDETKDQAIKRIYEAIEIEGVLNAEFLSDSNKEEQISSVCRKCKYALSISKTATRCLSLCPNPEQRCMKCYALFYSGECPIGLWFSNSTIRQLNTRFPYNAK